MKYERLTPKDLIEVINSNDRENIAFLNYAMRLHTLEDKMEQGIIKELPENAVVLTREEWVRLRNLEINYEDTYERYRELELNNNALKDKVVITREEYEQMKSLYNSQQGAIMTSSIGDLPLTVEGLRKAVDEITRLINVQTELQELNIKYYNDAKDLRRELKQARKETAREFSERLKEKMYENEKGYTEFLSGKNAIAIDIVDFENCLDEMLEEFMEVK